VYISDKIFLMDLIGSIYVKLLTDRQTDRQTPMITLRPGRDNSRMNV